MLRTLILSTTIMLTVNLVYGQTNNYEHISNNWKEGKVDTNENVIDGGIRRGGWDYLTLKRDSTVIYKAAFACGFGSKRTGTWNLDKQSNTLTFLFTNTEGYMNNTGNVEDTQPETYLIEKLTENELVLLHQNSPPPEQIAFFKN